MAKGENTIHNEKETHYYKPLFTNIEENGIRKRYTSVIDVRKKDFKSVEDTLKIYTKYQKEEPLPIPSVMIKH